MTTEELLMEIQDTDELLYTQAESELMLDYKVAVETLVTENAEDEKIRKELISKFATLSNLIVEYNDRVELSSDNVTAPSKEEIASNAEYFHDII